MPRRRLIDQVVGDVDPVDVVIVSAPAGSGKTTLLAEAAADLRLRGRPVAWLTCTPGQDLAALVRSLSDALTKVLLPGDTAAASLSTLAVPSRPSERDLMTALATVLQTGPSNGVVIVDDVHELVGDALGVLLRVAERQVSGPRLVLGGRHQPPAAVSRLRLSGRVAEIGARELAFTPAEADELWDREGLALGKDVAERIHHLTEGWAAGLRLAALSLQDEQDPEGFLGRFADHDRATGDYLAEEVLARLTSDERDFLLATCIPEAVSPDLARSLSGRPDAGEVLADLERRNALVLRLGSHGEWYRLHDLLRGYLQAELGRRHPARTRALHLLCARWFEEVGRHGEALRHAARAEDHDFTVSLLCRHGLGMLLSQESGPVRELVQHPSPALAQDPVVLVHRALTALDDGDLVTADAALAALSPAPSGPCDRRTETLVELAKVYRARLGADEGTPAVTERLGEIIRSVERLEAAGPVDRDIRLVLTAHTGVLRVYAGDPSAGEGLLRAATLAESAGLPHLALSCRSVLPAVLMMLNDFVASRQQAEDAIAFAERQGWSRSARLASAYVIAAWAAFEALDPEAAKDRAGRAIGVLDSSVDVEVDRGARIVEAIVTFDDPAHRRSALARLRRLTDSEPGRDTREAVAAVAPHELRMCLALGDRAGAEATVSRAVRALGDTPDVSGLRARLALARGRDAEARRHLAARLAGEPTPGAGSSVVSGWLLEATLAGRAGQPAAQTGALLEALDRGERMGVLRPFFDAGPELRLPLTSLQGRAGRSESFLARVLAALDRMDSWQGVRTPAGFHVRQLGGDPLTERELAVLRELPSHLTVAEIAAAHSVSVNTVKTQLRSIYAKLQVGSRREAVSVARARRLL